MNKITLLIFTCFLPIVSWANTPQMGLGILTALTSYAHGYIHPKKEDLEQKTIKNGLAVIDWVNPEKKDTYVSKIFDFLKAKKPQHLGAMQDYYVKRFKSAIFESSIIDNKHVEESKTLQEFTEVTAQKITQAPPQNIKFLSHNPQARETLVDAAVKNIRRISPETFESLLNTKINIFAMTIPATINDKQIEKLLYATVENFENIDTTILNKLPTFVNNKDIQKKLVNVTAKNITKHYSYHYITNLCMNWVDGEDYGKILAIAIKNNFDNVYPETIRGLCSLLPYHINYFTDKFIKNVNSHNFEELEFFLENSSYKNRYYILNALKAIIEKKGKTYHHLSPHDLNTLFDADFDLVNLYNKYKFPLIQSRIKVNNSQSNLSQTEAHLAINRTTTKSHFHKALQDPAIQQFLHTIHEQEKHEIQDGRITFVHGCKWDWDLRQELFTKLMELKFGKNIENYRFLRFKPDFINVPEEKDIREKLIKNGRIDNLRPLLFFMNHALFGNTNNLGSCTFDYWYKNSDLSKIDVNLKSLFETCGFEEYYTKYASEITRLETLHEAANNRGTLLLVSIDPQEADKYIYPARSGGVKTQVGWWKPTNKTTEIINKLKQDPSSLGKQSDSLEYCMVLTNDYALNPDKAGKDIKIFPFHMAGEKPEYKEYCKQRDILFKNIERDITEKNNPSVKNNKEFLNLALAYA